MVIVNFMGSSNLMRSVDLKWNGNLMRSVNHKGSNNLKKEKKYGDAQL